VFCLKGLDPLVQLLKPRPQSGAECLGLGWEMPVESPGRQPGLLGEAIDADPGKSTRTEAASRSLKDPGVTFPEVFGLIAHAFT
jgi:hypothetical protein